MLLANFNPNDAAYRRIEEIHKAGERATALTNHLLAFSGKQMLQPRTVNPADLLGNLEPVLSGALGEGIKIITRIDKDLNPVRVDPVLVQQAVVSLVDNALEAMPGGGTLTIELANTELDELSARVYDIPAGRYVMLAVKDVGRGIPSHIQRRMFEPFFTTKPPGQGRGLGLATAYGIIKQSGGHICLESEPGKGTTCKMFLPRDCDRPESAPAKPAQGMTARNETILVVEDDPAIRMLVEEILASAGYNVLVAGGPETGPSS